MESLSLLGPINKKILQVLQNYTTLITYHNLNGTMFTNLFKSALCIHLIHLNNESGLLTTGNTKML